MVEYLYRLHLVMGNFSLLEVSFWLVSHACNFVSWDSEVGGSQVQSCLDNSENNCVFLQTNCIHWAGFIACLHFLSQVSFCWVMSGLFLSRWALLCLLAGSDQRRLLTGDYFETFLWPGLSQSPFLGSSAPLSWQCSSTSFCECEAEVKSYVSVWDHRTHSCS